MPAAATETEIREGRFFAVIAYISFLCIIALLMKKDNRFAVEHGKHGLVLFVFEVGTFILTVIPFLGWLKQAGFVVFGLVSLWGILQALQGKIPKIPVISEMADKVIL